MRGDTPFLTLVAYSHFGAKGLKGVGMYYLVREAWKRGYVQQVITVSKSRCTYDFDLRLVDTLPGESRLISFLGQIKNKVWQEFPARWLGELIFDRYAAAKLAKLPGILIMTPRMVRVAQRAKALGYTTLLYGGTPDSRYLSKQIQAEQEAFGLDSGEKTHEHSRQMARFAAQMERVDYIIAASEFAKDTYVQHGFPGERIVVTPLGVDLRKFPASLPPSDQCFTYLFVAHVDGTTGLLKGLPYLLQAWCELGLHDARLVICGHISQKVREMVVQRYKGELKRVEFTGPVKDPQEYYRQASVFVFPSLAEGLAKVVLEAMASGRPVVTTPVLSPVVRDGVDGFYTPLRDVEALKEKMVYFYTRRAEVGRMGANASVRARQFSWERFSRQVADVVKTVSGA